ncbi:hypothetical protein [Burkholderia sp. Bp9140]|uniref:hypothetical protein n=1 Tax=Burkholderia sp. Bp9140 TaxID=2184572 RepID=UPI003908AFCF
MAAESSSRYITRSYCTVIGGLGAAVAEVLADEGAGVPLVRHGIYDEYSLIAPPTHLYAHYQLDGPGIEAVTRKAIARVM